uniref:Uncharacterized protein n=1 Tax=viral metagenome TaxID=1070528 RepID=A0A6C0JTD7_9ZZZZ
MDFIPLVTDEQRITFLRCVEPLCPDMKRVIWDMYLKTFEPELPPTPIKKMRDKIRIFLGDEEIFYQ